MYIRWVYGRFKEDLAAFVKWPSKSHMNVDTNIWQAHQLYQLCRLRTTNLINVHQYLVSMHFNIHLKPNRKTSMKKTSSLLSVTFIVMQIMRVLLNALYNSYIIVWVISPIQCDCIQICASKWFVHEHKCSCSLKGFVFLFTNGKCKMSDIAEGRKSWRESGWFGKEWDE